MKMTRHFDRISKLASALVIGAGIVGVSTGIWLRRAGGSLLIGLGLNLIASRQ